MLKAEIIAAGTELLLGETVDTNTAEISTWLADLGIGVYFHQTVGDNRLRMAAALSHALLRSNLIVITGGLGPTEDDMTKEVLAAVSGRPLYLHEESLAEIAAFFAARGRTMSENNRRQAMLPQGAEVLKNPIGTAPGVYVEINGAHVFCLPGVPSEMRAMWRESVVPILRRLVDGPYVISSRTLRFYGIGESDLETQVSDLLHGHNPTLAPYAGPGEVRLRITARASSEAEALRLIEPLEKEIEARVGHALYGKDDETLEGVVGNLLRETNRTLALAESCTGGLIAHRITNVAGSSTYFKQGWVVYSNEAKASLLGVDESVLKTHGAVSAECAAQMAIGALERAESDVALSVTGIAGPGGGSEHKPVGLVYFGLAGFGEVKTFRRVFPAPNREQVKGRSSSEALYLLWRHLLDGGASLP